MSNKQKPMLFGGMDLDARTLDRIAEFEEQNFDWSYVPGYSEQRIINEHAVRDGKQPRKMPKLFWVRASKTDGSNIDYREAVGTTRLGYRAATLEDLDEHGFGMPPVAHQGADGKIHHMDTVLAIVDYDQAQKNLKRQERITAEFEGRTLAPDVPGGSDAVEKQGVGVELQAAFENLSKT